MQSYRSCIQVGHQDQQASHLCSFKGCDQNIFLCAICLKDGRHFHGQQNLKHILNFIQFKELSLQKQACIIDYNQQREVLVIRCKNIEEDKSQNLIKKIKELRDFQEISQLITRVRLSAYIDIEMELVQQILFIEDEINIERIVLSQVQKMLSANPQNDAKNSIYQMFEQYINNKSQNAQMQQTQQEGKFKQKQLNYNILYEYLSDSEINTAGISHNGNFLVYGGENKILTIIDLKTGSIIKQVSLQSSITACAFTKKSRQLFVGDQQGNVQCFDDTFQMIYGKQIHQAQIKGIKFTDDNQILSFSSTNQIKLSDLQANQKHSIQDSIYELTCVEYQDTKYHKVIISCTKRNDINFYSADNGILLFHQDHIHDKLFAQQLLIIKGRSFLTANIYQIIIWLVNTQINKIQVYVQISLNFIQNISLVKRKNKIMVITQKCIQLFDRELNKLLDHEFNQQNQINIETLNQIQQVDSMEYIINSQEKSILILKRQK